MDNRELEDLDNRELEILLSALDELGRIIDKEEGKESYLKEILNLEMRLEMTLDAREEEGRIW